MKEPMKSIKFITILLTCVFYNQSFSMVKDDVFFTYPDSQIVSIDNYSFIIEDGGATIVKSANYLDSTCISIPTCVIYEDIQYVVKKIGPWAFSYCRALDSIVIPASIDLIGSGAFFGCKNLSYIKNYNPFVKLEDMVFDACTSLPCVDGLYYADNIIVKAKDKERYSYAIKDGTTIIAPSAFFALEQAQSVFIPSSIRIIGKNAFQMCSSLISIRLPDSLSIIEHNAFSDCSSLQSLIIPKGVTELYSDVTANSSKIKKIEVSKANSKYDSRDDCNAIIESSTNKLILGCSNTIIPNTVVEIGDEAFYGCKNFKKLFIPASVMKIGRRAFVGTGVESVVVDSNNPVYDSRKNCNAIIEKDSNTLLFGISSTRIPNSVKHIGRSAFERCEGLKQLKISSSILSIEDSAFAYCEKLKSVKISDRTTHIGKGAFMYCQDLQMIKLPKSLDSLSDNLFMRCNKLEKIEIPLLVESIGYNAFSFTSIKNVSLPNSINSINDYAFAFCSKLEEVEMPCMIDIISNHLFHNCENLHTVLLSGPIKTIGDFSFYGCKRLNNINIPLGVQIIGRNAFMASGINVISIPETVHFIGRDAFSDCVYLKEVDIPNSISTLSSNIFLNDNNLKTIQITSIHPPYVDSDEADFETLFYVCTLYVPKESIELYKNTSFWGRFRKIESIQSKDIQ